MPTKSSAHRRCRCEIRTLSATTEEVASASNRSADRARKRRRSPKSRRMRPKTSETRTQLPQQRADPADRA
ncbi:hypothetical protein C8039_13890 [Halogeometricum sp. wsp3]|nr:hypothetical protein C8039_13890 [Halogeometricum sp. wsp3]